jgi:hypothetical protein
MDHGDKVCEVKGSWNYVIEDVISRVAERAKCMAVLCSYASKYYDRQRTYLLVPASTISWGLNIFGMISTYLGSEVISESLVVLIASMGNFIIATITTVAEKSKAGDKVELFNQASKDFHLIYSDISTQLSFEPQLRGPPSDLFDKSDEQYKRLLQSIPNIPESLVSKFYRKFHNCNVTFPDHLASFGLKRVELYSPRPEVNVKAIMTSVDDILSTELKVKKFNVLKKPSNNIKNNIKNEQDSNTIDVNINDNNDNNEEKDNFFDSEMGELIDEKPIKPE